MEGSWLSRMTISCHSGGTLEIVVSDLGKQLMNEGQAVVARRLDLEYDIITIYI